MAKFKSLKVGDEYLLKLSRLQKNADSIIKQAVYKGAGVVADSIQKSIQGLPEERHRRLKNGEMFQGVSSTQKEALEKGFGLSEMEQDRKGWNTKAGFTGYADKSTATKKYPNGLPIPMLARSIESGSPIRRKTPFVRTAVKSSRKHAVNEMESTINMEIKKTMK